MARYGILNIDRNNFYGAQLAVRKGNIIVEDFIENSFSEEIFKTNPFGVIPKDINLLNEKISYFLSDRKIKNWCLLLPDLWQKSLIIEEENVPKTGREMKIFVEWHFKKAYNLRPEEVRFSYILFGNNGKNKVLITFCLEKLLSIIESLFKNNKKHLGLITSSFWALSFLIPKKGIWALLSIERDIWTLGIFEGEKLLSLRQKMLPGENFDVLQEEIERTIKIQEKPLENFYINSNNPDFNLENLVLPFNLLKPGAGEVKVLKEPPLWWQSLEGPFLGAIYGIS